MFTRCPFSLYLCCVLLQCIYMPLERFAGSSQLECASEVKEIIKSIHRIHLEDPQLATHMLWIIVQSFPTQMRIELPAIGNTLVRYCSFQAGCCSILILFRLSLSSLIISFSALCCSAMILSCRRLESLLAMESSTSQHRLVFSKARGDQRTCDQDSWVHRHYFFGTSSSLMESLMWCLQARSHTLAVAVGHGRDERERESRRLMQRTWLWWMMIGREESTTLGRSVYILWAIHRRSSYIVSYHYYCRFWSTSVAYQGFLGVSLRGSGFLVCTKKETLNVPLKINVISAKKVSESSTKYLPTSSLQQHIF